MADSDDIFSVPQWYAELQEIRERLGLESKHLKKIEEFETLMGSSFTAEGRIPIVEVINAMLISYPVLSKHHLKEWERLRSVCLSLVKLDKDFFVDYFRVCTRPVFEEAALGAVECAAMEEVGYYTAPFDVMDQMVTLYENKSDMPFTLLDYDEKQLLHVVQAIKRINIREVIEYWLEEYPVGIYPEVLELYKIHGEDGFWFPVQK